MEKVQGRGKTTAEVADKQVDATNEKRKTCVAQASRTISTDASERKLQLIKGVQVLG